MASPAAGSLWLGPIHISKFLPAALSTCFPWWVVWSGTSSMLLHDAGNRNCSIPLLCSSRNWLHFGKAGSGSDFWNSSDSGNKVTRKMLFQDKTENVSISCWKSWRALLCALSNSVMTSYLLSPSCFFFPLKCTESFKTESGCGEIHHAQSHCMKGSNRSSVHGIPLEINNEFGVAFHDKCLQGINLIQWMWVCAAPLILTILSKMDLTLLLQSLAIVTLYPTSVAVPCLVFHPFIHPLWLSCCISSLGCSRYWL